MQRTLLGFGCAVFLGAIILGAGCTFDEPFNPRWDVQLVVPLSEQQYSLMDLVDSLSPGGSMQYGIGMQGSDSLLFFFYQDNIPYTTIGDSLYIPPQEDSLTSRLGNVYLDADIDDSSQFSLGTINPALIPHHGQSLPVPSFNFGPINDDLNPCMNLQYAVVDSGYLHYAVVNDLPVPLNNIHITLFQTEPPNTVILQETVPTIDPYSTIIDSVNMHGVRIVRYMSIAIQGTSPGSTTPVEIDTADCIAIHFEMGRIKVTSALGYFPAQTVTQDTLVGFETEHLIREVRIRSGAIHLQSNNQTQLATLLRIQVFNFISPSGLPLENEVYIEPGQSVDTSIALDGYSMEFPPPYNQTLHVFAQAFFDSSSTEIYYDASTQVFATYQTDTLFLEYIDGVIDTISMAIGPEEQEVEQIPEGWDQLTLVGASLTLRIDSDIEANILTDLHVTAFREGLPQDSIIIHRTIVPNRDTVLVIEGLERLIHSRPDRIVIAGTAGIFGDVHLASLNYIQGVILLDVPMCFSMEPSVIHGKIEEFEEPISEPIRSAVVAATVRNALPLTGHVVVLVTHDSTLFRTNPAATDTLVDVLIELPTIANGRVVEPLESEVLIALLEHQFDLFSTAPVYLQPVYILDGTQGDTLSAYAVDYLAFSCIGRFVYEIDTE